MLAKQHRLQKDRDFELVFKKGRAFNGKFIFLKLKRNNLKISRFGFIVGTKISKKSSVRNKIKRRLREVIRKRLGDIKPGFDIAVGTKTEILEKNYQNINKDVEQLFKKAGLI